MKHAILSPSSSERWATCPASVRVTQGLDSSSDSVYAAEGTKAHELAEIELRAAIGDITPRQRTLRYNRWAKDAPDDLDDMKRYVQGYVDYVLGYASEIPLSQILVEQTLDTGIPECWGTSDAVIISPDRVIICDLKYGQGLRVDAMCNSQLRLYGLGALRTFGDLIGETLSVTTIIYQPRLNHISTETLIVEEMRAWRDWVLPRAAEALAGSTTFHPSETACRWCPVAGTCRARLEYVVQNDFAPPDLLDATELGSVLGLLPDIRRWCGDVEAAALELAYTQGTDIPGWKPVLSGGRRIIRDQDSAIAAFMDQGLSIDDVATTSLRGIGVLERVSKTLGTTLEGILGDLVERTPGRPSLVPTNDPRPAVTALSEALDEFSGEDVQ